MSICLHLGLVLCVTAIYCCLLHLLQSKEILSSTICWKTNLHLNMITLTSTHSPLLNKELDRIRWSKHTHHQISLTKTPGKVCRVDSVKCAPNVIYSNGGALSKEHVPCRLRCHCHCVMSFLHHSSFPTGTVSAPCSVRSLQAVPAFFRPGLCCCHFVHCLWDITAEELD